MITVGIGASIFLLAAGAIITFALDLRVGWLDLDVVGWVLMAAGAVGLIVTMTIFGSRRRSVVTSTTTPPSYPPPVERRTVDEVSEYDRPL
jgi:hypothetical protein